MMQVLDLTPSDRALLEETGDALRQQRTRSAADRQRFSASVLARLPRSTAPDPRHPRLWMVGLAVAVAASAVLVWFLGIGDTSKESDALRLWRLRGQAQPVALADPVTRLENPDLLGGMAGDRLVVMIISHHGERCMWLYPQRLVSLGHDDQADLDYKRHEKWFVNVENGHVNLPSDALQRLAKGELVAIRVDEHIEIWRRKALARHLSQSPV